MKCNYVFEKGQNRQQKVTNLLETLKQTNNFKVFQNQLPYSTRKHTSCDQKRKIEQLYAGRKSILCPSSLNILKWK